MHERERNAFNSDSISMYRCRGSCVDAKYSQLACVSIHAMDASMHPEAVFKNLNFRMYGSMHASFVSMHTDAEPVFNEF